MSGRHALRLRACPRVARTRRCLGVLRGPDGSGDQRCCDHHERERRHPERDDERVRPEGVVEDEYPSDDRRHVARRRRHRNHRDGIAQLERARRGEERAHERSEDQRRPGEASRREEAMGQGLDPDVADGL
jgi:hypothetical protein